MYSIKRGNRYLLATLLSFVFGSLILGFVVFLGEVELDITWQIIISQWGIVFIPILLYLLITKSKVKETFILNKIDFINVLLSFALAFSIIPLLSLINVLSQFFVKNMVSDAIMDITQKPLWVSLLFMALTPALLEEFAMRGIIINNYRSKPVLTTCLISGFFFGMFHMNLNQFFYAFVMGIIMCFIVHLTGSIFSSVIIHFTINASSLILVKALYLAEEFMSKVNPDYAAQLHEATTAAVTTSSLMMSALLMFGMCLFAIPLALLILYGLMKHNKKSRILKDKLSTAQVLNISLVDQNPLVKEKIVTPAFIMSVTIFGSFVLLFEVLLPLISKLFHLE